MSGIEGPGVLGGGGGAADWNTLLNRPQSLVDIGDGTAVNLALLAATVQTSLELLPASILINGSNILTETIQGGHQAGAPGAINNVNLGNGTHWSVQTDNANNSFTGILAPANENRVAYLYNRGPTGSLTLTHQDAASDAANRIICPNAASVVLRVGGGCRLRYDNSVSRWRVSTVL